MRRRDNGEGTWTRVPIKKNGKTVGRKRVQITAKNIVSASAQKHAKTPVLCAVSSPLTPF